VLAAALLITPRLAAADLVAASAKGDLAAVRELLEKGSDVNARSGLDTPLTAAARMGHAEVVRVLLASNADVTLRYGSNAPLRGHTEKAKRVFDRECDACHTPTLGSGKRGPALLGLTKRTLNHGRPPVYENVLHLINEGSDLMPAFREQLSEEEREAVASWLLLREDPLVGMTALELAEYGCHAEVVRALEGTGGAEDSAASDRTPISYLEVLRCFVDMQRYLCRIQIRHGTGVSSYTKRSLGAVDFLFDRWRSSPPAAWKASDYDRSLNVVRSSLRRVARSDSIKDVLPPLAEITTELEIKEDDCRRSKENMGRLVPVAVHTVKQEQPAKGWQVLYKPKLLEIFPDVKGEPFPLLSTPSNHKLPPGRYIVYARKPGTEIASEPLVITVGGSIGSPDWQLPVP
jgi:mono/diheme cytochrome c family protein